MASLKNVRVAREDSCYVIEREGARLKTPAGREYRVPTQALAEAIAEEWRAQTDDKKIDAKLLPLSRLAATAIDLVPANRQQKIDQLAAYASSELLCHRADDPPNLAARQEELWQPFLAWAAQRFEAPLCNGKGIMPIRQSASAIDNLRCAIEACDDFALVGLSNAVEASGSLVLGLAIAEAAFGVDAVFHAAELETHFQNAKWGTDPATQSRLDTIRQDLEITARWFGTLKKD